MATTPLRIVGPVWNDLSEIVTVLGTPTIDSSIKPPGAAYSIKVAAAASVVAFRIDDFGATAGTQVWNKAAWATSFWFYYDALPSATSAMFLCRHGAGVQITVRLTNLGFIQLAYVDGTGTTITVGNGPAALTTGTWHFIACKAANVATASGASFEIYADGVYQQGFSGVTLTTAPANTQQLRYGVSTAITVNEYFSRIVISDGDYITATDIKAIRPDSAGSLSTGWAGGTGATYAEVDDTDPDDDTTYIQSSASGDAMTFGLESRATARIQGSILAVCAMGMIADEGGASNLALRLRSGTTNSDTTSGDPGVASPTYTIVGKMFTTDPNTGAAWTGAAIDALEVGVVNSAAVAARCSALVVAVLSTGGQPIQLRRNGVPGARTYSRGFGRTW